MHVNGRIIAGTLIIMAAGTYHTLLINKTKVGARGPTVTRVLVGGYVLAVIASIFDLINPDVAYISGLMLMLAVMTALYAILPDLMARFSAIQTTEPTVHH